MKFVDRFFHSEVGVARAYLLSRALPLLIALDIWVLMVGHGARYGTAGFNVAHFAWLDAMQPIPTPAIYTGVMLLCGLLALTVAFTGGNVLLSGALCLLYTYGWSMSMLDSYQHHYFISWMLLCLTCVPQTAALEIAPLSADVGGKSRKKQAQRERADARESRGWMYLLIVAIVVTLHWMIDAPTHPWVAFVLMFGALLVATSVHAAASKQTPPMGESWGFTLAAATIAVVYGYTSLAKCDAQWVAGATIRQISSAEQIFAGLADWMVALGIERERFWALLSLSVIPLELLVAASYVVSVIADRDGRPWARRFTWVGFALAMQLHVGAEAMGLEIGWFSYYMMLTACVFLLPPHLVHSLATLFAWPARFVTKLLADWETDAADDKAWSITAPLLFGVAFVVLVVGYSLDLPGAQVAAIAAVSGFAFVGVVTLRRAGHAPIRRALLGLAGAAAVMWIAVNVSEVRFDYYRYLGGDLRRREQPEAALDAYLKAERYSPPGQSRKRDIDALKQQLRK